MTTIKLNGIEYEFKYSFKALTELLKAENLKLEQLTEFGQDFTKCAIIAHYGIGKVLTIQEIEDSLDKAKWDDVIAIIEAFASEVSQYFSTQKKTLTNTSELGTEG